MQSIFHQLHNWNTFSFTNLRLLLTGACSILPHSTYEEFSEKERSIMNIIFNLFLLYRNRPVKTVTRVSDKTGISQLLTMCFSRCLAHNYRYESSRACAALASPLIIWVILNVLFRSYIVLFPTPNSSHQNYLLINIKKIPNGSYNNICKNVSGV